MADQSPIWERARRDLVFMDEDGNQDVFLWEHVQRVARNARHIAMLPEVPTRRIDRNALEAAALYHDAGWVCQLREGAVHRLEILCKPTCERQHHLAAALLAESLSDHLKPRTLETAAMLVRQLGDRHLRAVEARILADADALDDIGSLSLWNMVRRHTFEGKGIEAALQTWQRQREFRFWEARINKSVHFEVVKRIALQRLEQLDQFMSILARHDSAADLLEQLEATTHRAS